MISLKSLERKDVLKRGTFGDYETRDIARGNNEYAQRFREVNWINPRWIILD